MFYLDLGDRDTEEWLLASDQICRELELSRIPDHATFAMHLSEAAYAGF